MIIGISGKKQHGKNMIASIIQYLYFKKKVKDSKIDFYCGNSRCFNNWTPYEKEHHSGWQVKAFADKLKDIVCMLIGCTREQLEDNTFKETPLGEEWRVWYWFHYKLPTTNNPFQRLGGIYVTKEEALQEKERWTQSITDEGEIRSYILTPRLLLQLLGTDCGRRLIHPNIWVNATMADYKVRTKKHKETGIRSGNNEWVVPPYPHIPEKYHGTILNDEKFIWHELLDAPNWIISDVRFPNEVKAIEDRGGLVLRVVRNFGIEHPKDEHESETALDDHQFKITILNDGTIGQLVEMVENSLKFSGKNLL